MKFSAALLAIAIASLAVIALIRPLTAQSRSGSLEDRVYALEIQVSSLNARVAALDKFCGLVGDKSIKRTFTGIGETWTLKTIWGNGSILTLYNGTKWQIGAEDAKIAGAWKLGDVILIGTNNDRKYPYLLTNTTRQQRVEADYIGTQ